MAKILIVDDDEKVTSLLGRYLNSLGFQVMSINQSSKAMEAAEGMSPDLIILDVMMSPPDGFTLTSMLRNDVKFAKTPIIIITALAKSTSRASALGANDYLEKPFNLDELTISIKKLLPNLTPEDEPIRKFPERKNDALPNLPSKYQNSRLNTPRSTSLYFFSLIRHNILWLFLCILVVVFCILLNVLR